MAFLRYKQGAEQAFAPSYEAEPGNEGGYSSYPDAVDPDGGYSQPPFNNTQQPQAGMSDWFCQWKYIFHWFKIKYSEK